ncbi:MAG TPA: phenylalanine--tRNA ligase subunit beta [Acidimicrobiales bacterium]|nr:phenylalanine--tRNA ligase subunit beta [Acidimicrobiales bacterium]
MRVPLSWLRDFAPIEVPPEEVAATLDRLGLVVEAIDRVGQGLEGVVVARVSEISSIPGADRIRRVVVDAGDADPVEVVCGAWNFNEGDVVALATVGTVLPGAPGPITRRKMKGAVSNGMLCSGAELGLSEDHAGILVLPSGLELGARFTDAMGITADVVFDLDITPNRPDAMSIVGVARDLAAALRVPFDRAGPALDESGPDATSVATIRLEAGELCPRFAARVMTDVVVSDAPDVVARRLTLAGMRPINSVVDASNYVMLELGQPSHPYDLDRLPGGGLLVRPARPAEILVTLDGVERRLGDGPHPDCLICDLEGNPVGIAGVMGGASSEISESTTRVLLEVAYFDPMAVARTSKRLGLRTEASARFERGCDPEALELAAARVCALTAAAGARVSAGAIVEGGVPPRRRIRVRPARVNRLLGTSLAPPAVTEYLEPLGFTIQAEEPDAVEVEVPSWRPDVSEEIDLVEEVARHHGYSRIERTVPLTPQVGSLTTYQRERRRLREVMAGAGLTEVWTPSMLPEGDHALVGLDPAHLEIENPLSRDETVLRRTMLPGILRALRYNAGHRNVGLRVFEVGHVFPPPAPGQRLPDERELLSAALWADGDDAAAAVRLWRTVADALRLDSPALVASTSAGLHPARCAQARVAGEPVGHVGEVDPSVVAAFGVEGRVGWLELDLGLLADAPRHPGSAQPVSVYPSSDIDLAFAVDEGVPAATVEATLRDAAGELLSGLWLFDVYRDATVVGEGRRSLAWRLRFVALDRTLTDDEVAEIRRRCIEAVESNHPAALRG